MTICPLNDFGELRIAFARPSFGSSLLLSLQRSRRQYPHHAKTWAPIQAPVTALPVQYFHLSVLSERSVHVAVLWPLLPQDWHGMLVCWWWSWDGRCVGRGGEGGVGVVVVGVVRGVVSVGSVDVCSRAVV